MLSTQTTQSSACFKSWRFTVTSQFALYLIGLKYVTEITNKTSDLISRAF